MRGGASLSWMGRAGLVLALGGCAAAPLHVTELDDVERTRTSAASKESAAIAPEAFARAEQERARALEAHRAGDEVAATLHAERANAAYSHAAVIARLARDGVELADAQKTLDDAVTQEQALHASRARLDHDADDDEKRVRAARERALPAASGPASPEREAARMVAARALAMQAKLLCDAAALAAPQAEGLEDAGSELAALDERLAKNARPAPIDSAAQARTHCLDVLTRARRGASDDAGASDALLAELSAAGGWDPARDERGVLVTMHDAFAASDLTSAVAAKLRDLGRVAAAHPGFAVQLVVHDASPPAAGDTTDAKRAAAAVQALVAGGATAARVRSELAGARAPIVDPSDPHGRERNERLDVVFVSAGVPAPAATASATGKLSP